ncbi:MAG: glycosyltransferase [Ruminococcus sp.]|nr:glycosyltransferase [Ruminococcus sp.]
MASESYAVLMAVYKGDNAEHFKTACESMLAQTLPASEFIIVADGPLTPSLDKVCDELTESYPIIGLIRCKKNRGLAKALNTGLKHCTCEYIARMDADDISLPERCETELAVMKKLGLDIVSSTVAEFESDPSQITTLKTLPSSHKAILKYARTRNPFNHPCVMFRRSAVEAVGGYRDRRFFEDYDLWVRMLNNGSVGYNIKKPLLKMRTGSGMFKRRGGLAYLGYARKMERFKLSIGFCSLDEYLYRMSAFTVFCLAPSALRERMYKKLLRRKEDQP